MTTRRSRGEGGLHWDEKRARWIATIELGTTAAGKRSKRKAAGRTKTEAKEKLKKLLRDLDDGVVVSGAPYTVADAVRDWFEFGLVRVSDTTRKNYTTIATVHIVAKLGARQLKDLKADDVDRWLAREATTASTRYLRLMHSLLSRIIDHAVKRDKVFRNVVALSQVPDGQVGRPSKSLNLTQAEALLKAADGAPLEAYIVLSLLIGARTEKLRQLLWRDVDLRGQPDTDPPVPPSIAVVRSVRAGGDTKTRKSRRRLAMPLRCVEVLEAHRGRLGRDPRPDELVFASRAGTPLDSHNVRRSFRAVVGDAGMDPGEWTPRELRHSFVSLLSDNGVPLEVIARLVGHSGTSITETVYRHQLTPVLQDGARTMDMIFPGSEPER